MHAALLLILPRVHFSQEESVLGFPLGASLNILTFTVCPSLFFFTHALPKDPLYFFNSCKLNLFFKIRIEFLPLL